MKWAVFPEVKGGKKVDPVYIEAKTKAGSKRAAEEVLKLFNIQPTQILNLCAVPMEDLYKSRERHRWERRNRVKEEVCHTSAT